VAIIPVYCAPWPGNSRPPRRIRVTQRQCRLVLEHQGAANDQGGGTFEVTFADKGLTCRECGTGFVFTAGEQSFFAEKGLMNEPQRCPECRAVRRRERLGREPREMHAVVCAACGVQTTVPFLPRYDRPVYCSTCFERVRVGAEA
jgi:CxxC-x17-CxxC domain-containing protein